ncbi:conserved hypothetical protein [Nitrobacter hamburgensis X14]|uniref:Phage capsid-like C-terminal domain-containing protein n=1 Tax=Nitrobacter hamburgensis (strain DSM 10229 / NCIMB 13809 / X14) TaxID=323097 RepID=Q1QLF0_NITHX|nr:phage major capsid protein [Nitrobacter hamburgensis]ABE62947.1 conserved hypothetical protein [Nitrobacter hamburgensis X14]
MLAGKDNPDETEIRSLGDLDKEFQTNEQRFRAALVAESEERAAAGAEMETSGTKEWDKLVGGFEMRQVAAFYTENRNLEGATKEVADELRSKGSYQGIPVPLSALETRSGETVSSGIYSPKSTAALIDRLFPQSVASQMGVQMINIASGSQEWPLTSSSVASGWVANETSNVPGPTAYTTSERSVAPNNTLGITMTLTRKSLKQAGEALEAAVRRDMNGCISQALDKAVFLGAGSGGEPLGLITGAATYGISSVAINAAASWAKFRDAVVAFMVANAATGPGGVKMLVRPEVYSTMDSVIYTGTATSEWDKTVANLGSVITSSNALAAPTGSPLASKAFLTCSPGNVAPAVLATFGALDVIRDIYTSAPSGEVKLTGLLTADISALRAVQSTVLTGIQ